MPLTSKILSGNSRLDQAAAGGTPLRELPQVDDPEAVKRVQKALVALGFSSFFTSKSFPQGLNGEPDGRYGTETLDAVKAFQKQVFPNDPGQQDGRVGRLTLPEMDRRLPQGRNPDRPRPDVPVDPKPPAQGLPLDIFVLFSGTPPGVVAGSRDTAAEAEFKKNFNTPAYLKTHQPAEPVCFFGGRNAEDHSKNAADEVLRLRGQTKNGVTAILGVSIGGFPALNTAALLTPKLKLDYVAINDGAFFEGFNDINSFNPLRIRLPGGITADRKDNFSQIFGHGLLTDSRNPSGFMQGAEFHGPLEGFNNTNMALAGTRTVGVIAAFSAVPGGRQLPLAAKKPVATKAHVAAVADADPLIDKVLKSLIKP